VNDSEVLIVVVTRERATRSCSTTDGSGASRTTVDDRPEATRALVDALIVSGGSSIIEHRRDRDTEKRKLIDCATATTI